MTELKVSVFRFTLLTAALLVAASFWVCPSQVYASQGHMEVQPLHFPFDKDLKPPPTR